MRTSTIFSAIVALGAFACSDSGDDENANTNTDATDEPAGGPEPTSIGYDVPDPPEGGYQLVGPEFEVLPGEEAFTCFKMGDVQQELLIQSSQVFQAEGGHHVILFHSPGLPDVETAPHTCVGGEMAGNVRFATAGTSGGVGIHTPPGIAMVIPAESEIWAQSHYINASSETVTVQDAVNFELLDPSNLEQLAGTFSHVDLDFELPPQTQTTRTLECEIPQAMTIPWVLPHMHEWGAEYAIEILDGENVIWESSGQWRAEWRDELFVENLEPPLRVEAGNVLRTTCVWDNTEAEAITFPQEMCVTFFPYYPAEGEFLVCANSGNVFGLD